MSSLLERLSISSRSAADRSIARRVVSSSSRPISNQSSAFSSSASAASSTLRATIVVSTSSSSLRSLRVAVVVTCCMAAPSVVAYKTARPCRIFPRKLVARARDVADDRGELLWARPHRPVARRQIDIGHVPQFRQAREKRIALLQSLLVLLGGEP